MYAINTTEILPRDLEVATPDDLKDADVYGLAPLHLAVGVMLVMVLVFITMFMVLRRRAIINQAAGGQGLFGANSNAGLADYIIESIPIVKYGDQRILSAGNSEGCDCCSICLCEYEEGEDVRFLPCKHIFHPACVDTWLKRNASCPSCRQSIRTMMRNEERRERGEGEDGEEEEEGTLVITPVEIEMGVLSRPSGEGEGREEEEGGECEDDEEQREGLGSEGIG